MKKIIGVLLVVLLVFIGTLFILTRNTTVTTALINEKPFNEDYDPFPYLDDAAWPVMRGDLQNTGRSRFLIWDDATVTTPAPVHFSTGNGIFSTPVIDDRDRIYVGSADHYFYALDPLSEKELWRYRTGEIIDSAAALGKGGMIYIPSGDSIIHALDVDGNPHWEFDVLHDRPDNTFSTSTCFWWEGNVVIGPDGYIYSGNDDFYFYCLEDNGEMRWAYSTGFFIWSAAAFDKDNTVYVPSFDMNLYAFDRREGKLLWKRNFGNPLISSPAVGDDGTIYQGCMDGSIHALNPDNGATLWSTKTRGHVYASAAIATDNMVYITSADGELYALDATDGTIKWSFYTGEAVRSSPVLGPDPEMKEEYLIYFGGGNGHLYCIDPEGKRRWSYDTLVRSTGYVDYPNINASPALGRSGLAVASANGDIIWIPYDYYLNEDAMGIILNPEDGFEEEGAAWHYVTPGGQIDRKPLHSDKPSEPIIIHAAQTVNLHLLVRDNHHTVPASIITDSIRIAASPDFKHRFEVLGDGVSLAIIPEEIMKSGTDYKLQIEALYEDQKGNRGDVAAELLLETTSPELAVTSVYPRITAAEFATEEEYEHYAQQLPAYAITHMAIPYPPIVPSLDQIGLASLTIPFAIVETDPQSGTFSAWSVQRFGETEEGEVVGVPDSRILFYAFGGSYTDGAFIMESLNGHFEVTGFPMPLDTLRFAGELNEKGEVKIGASLYADIVPPGGLSGAKRLFNDIFSVSGEEKGGQRNWVLEMYREGGFLPFLKASRVALSGSLDLIKNRVWSDWGFINDHGKFAGTGTYQMKSLPVSATELPGEATVNRFEYIYSGKNREIVAEIVLPSVESGFDIIPGILLINKETGHPHPLNYNLSTVRERVDGNTKLVTLTIPKELNIKPDTTKAILMADLTPVLSIEF